MQEYGQITEFLTGHRCTGLYLDVGTNIGVVVRKLFEPQLYYGSPAEAYFLHAFGPAPRCGVCAIGLEPNPAHRSRLAELQQSLNAAGAAVLILQAGISHTDGSATFSRGQAAHGEWDASVIDGNASACRRPGTCVTISTLNFTRLTMHVAALLRAQSPDPIGWHGYLSTFGGPPPKQDIGDLSAPRVVMKLDVEGLEYSVLHSTEAQQALCGHIDYMFVEWHEKGPRARQVRAALESRAQRADCRLRLFDLDDEGYAHDKRALPSTTVCGNHRVNGTEQAMAVAQPGHCGQRKAGRGDCSTGDGGTWPLDSRIDHVTLGECILKCRSCARCAFVSHSFLHDECRWTATCDKLVADDQRGGKAGSFFRTVAARKGGWPDLAGLADGATQAQQLSGLAPQEKQIDTPGRRISNTNCPRLFVHTLPDAYRGSANKDAYVGRAFGSPVQADGLPFHVYDGQQFQLGEIVLQRALGYRCRTLDPREADLYLIPAFSHAIGRGTRSANNSQLYDWLRRVRKPGDKGSVFEAKGGADHIIIMARDGLPWDEVPFPELDYRDGQLGSVIKLGIAEYGESWKSQWSDMKGVNVARPDTYHSVPYPAMVHANPTLRGVPWLRPQWRRNVPLVACAFNPRKHLDTTAGMLRHALITNCASHGEPWCALQGPEGQNPSQARIGDQLWAEFAALYFNATFCLQPIGDTITRKAMVDSLLVGCIPVLFHVGQRQQWRWHWGSWVANASVLFDATKVTSGEVDVVAALRSISQRQVAEMQATILQHAHTMQWSTIDSTLLAHELHRTLAAADSPPSKHGSHAAAEALADALMRDGDAFDVALHGAWQLARIADAAARMVPNMRDGYCDLTTITTKGEQGDRCTSGSKGTVTLPPSVAGTWTAAVVFCARFCSGCMQCKFISVSLRLKDCSWFTSCDMDHLQGAVRGFRSATAASFLPTAPSSMPLGFGSRAV